MARTDTETLRVIAMAEEFFPDWAIRLTRAAGRPPATKGHYCQEGRWREAPFQLVAGGRLLVAPCPHCGRAWAWIPD